MASEPVIRSYQSLDHDAVVRLWAAVFPNEPAHNKSEDVIARKSQVQPVLFYVATMDGAVIGTVLAGYDGVRGWVHKLAVSPSCRRLGIASKLMQQAERGLSALGCTKLNLQVRGSNAQAVKFYEALGYAVEDIASLGKHLT